MAQKRKKTGNNGMGFINPPYQNGKPTPIVHKPQRNVVLPVFHKMARRIG